MPANPISSERRVVLFVNPASGAGRAAAAARRLAERVGRAGFATEIVESLRGGPAGDLAATLRDAHAVLVVGGDGTVRAAAGAAIGAGTPLYHVPFGTVNLFGRALGMDGRERTILAALERGDVARVDAGTANGEPFLLMASLGVDAEVVHDVTSRRRAAISRLSYLGPMTRRALSWRPPSLEARVDGERVVRDEPGLVLVGNCSGYMWGLDPARRADMTDGLLDLVFFPIRTRTQLLRWSIKCIGGRHLNDPRLVYRLGRRIEILPATPQHVQIDGDPPPGREPVDRLDVTIRPGALAVLAPPRRRGGR